MYMKVCVLLVLWNISEAAPNELLVKTNSGWVRGKLDTSVTGKPVNAFLGIPYAEPPLGHLRFLRPVPIMPWPEVLNVTSLPSSCVQRILKVAQYIPVLKHQAPMTPLSEDCLKVNIWVPVKTTIPAPVIVFIHGGGFSVGSSATPVTLGDALSSEGDIIVVTINYRVASLGFLFLDDDSAPGNVGLYDQRLALEWIHENIAAFGGDPENISVYGQSVGACSVLIHLLSGKSDKIIRRIILSSVGRLSHAVRSRESMLERALKLAGNVGCLSNPTNVSAIAECLRNTDAEELIANEPVTGYNYIVFYPIVDGDMMPKDWIERFNEGRFKAVDVLMGSNKNEGTIFMIVSNPVVFQPVRNEVRPVLQDFKDILSLAEISSDLLRKTIEFHYTDWMDLENSEKILEASEKVIEEILFSCSTNRYSQLLQKDGKAKLYRYYNVNQPPSSQAPKWFKVFHGSDLFYVFGHVFTKQPTLPRAELDFALRIMSYWSNFAKTGNPNEGSNSSQKDVMWPQSSVSEGTYLVLSPNSTSTGHSYRVRHCAFWDIFLPDLAADIGLYPNQTATYLGF